MSEVKRSPLALIVLALLVERPMHPYQMQVVIKRRAKDEVFNVKDRTQLYRTINRLLDHALIEVHKTERDQSRPERTVYALTDDGRRTAETWLRELLAEPENEFPQFPAALSIMALLPVDEVVNALAKRRAALQARLDHGDWETSYATEIGLPRLFVLESEYLVAITRAEVAWIDGVLADLASGELTWSAEWLAELSARFEPEPPMS